MRNLGNRCSWRFDVSLFTSSSNSTQNRWEHNRTGEVIEIVLKTVMIWYDNMEWKRYTIEQSTVQLLWSISVIRLHHTMSDLNSPCTVYQYWQAKMEKWSRKSMTCTWITALQLFKIFSFCTKNNSVLTEQHHFHWVLQILGEQSML